MLPGLSSSSAFRLRVEVVREFLAEIGDVEVGLDTPEAVHSSESV